MDIEEHLEDEIQSLDEILETPVSMQERRAMRDQLKRRRNIFGQGLKGGKEPFYCLQMTSWT